MTAVCLCPKALCRSSQLAASFNQRLQVLFCFFIFIFLGVVGAGGACLQACRILVPQPGTEPGPGQ